MGRAEAITADVVTGDEVVREGGVAVDGAGAAERIQSQRHPKRQDAPDSSSLPRIRLLCGPSCACVRASIRQRWCHRLHHRSLGGHVRPRKSWFCTATARVVNRRVCGPATKTAAWVGCNLTAGSRQTDI